MALNNVARVRLKYTWFPPSGQGATKVMLGALETVLETRETSFETIDWRVDLPLY